MMCCFNIYGLQIDTLRQLQDRPEVVRLIDTFEVSILWCCVVFRMACLLPLLSVPAKSFKPGLHIIDVMQDEDRVWIVTELCSGGDLEHFIKVRDLMICEVGGAHRCALSASWKLAHTPEPVLSGVPLLAGLRAHDRTRGCACST